MIVAVTSSQPISPGASEPSTDFVVDGWLEGDVSTAGRVVIGPHGHLVGCVCAAELVVAGRLEGTVHGGRIHVRPTGRIDGDVEYGHLRVDDGGAVEARLARLPVTSLRVPLLEDLVEDEPWQVYRKESPEPAPAALAQPLVLSRNRRQESGSSGLAVLARDLRQAAASVARGAMLAAAGAVVCGLSVVPTSEPQAALLAASDVPRTDATAAGLDWRLVRTPWLSREAMEVVDPPTLLDDEEIRWLATGGYSLRRLAYAWGIPREQLETLNPELDPEEELADGTEVSVYRKGKVKPVVSVGAPNLGFLAAGMPMPEGPSWDMPRSRRRAYGARQTIETLVQVFETYGRSFRDAPPAQLGDISAFGGREIRPHRSHQSGRDVDIYFVRSKDPQRPHVSKFDGEKNWFLVRQLIDSGKVQEIFVDQRVQYWLREAARAELPEEEVARYFTYLNHESGHVHHMHVRFECSADNALCRPHSIPELWPSSEEPQESEDAVVEPERMAQTVSTEVPTSPTPLKGTAPSTM